MLGRGVRTTLREVDIFPTRTPRFLAGPPADETRTNRIRRTLDRPDSQLSVETAMGRRGG